MKNTNENKKMVLSQTKEIKHHADELSKVLGKHKDIESWVVGKIERASTDLSDVTHYLDGKNEYKKGGELRENMQYVKVNNEGDAENILFYADKQDIASSYRKSAKDGSFTIILEKPLKITKDMQPRYKEIIEKQKNKMVNGGELGGFCYSIGGL